MVFKTTVRSNLSSIDKRIIMRIRIRIKGRGPRLFRTLQCAAFREENRQRRLRRSSQENWESGALETQWGVQDGVCNQWARWLLNQTRDHSLSKLPLVVISSAPTASPVPVLPHPSWLQWPANWLPCLQAASLFNLTQYSSDFAVYQNHLERKSSTEAQHHLSSRRLNLCILTQLLRWKLKLTKLIRTADEMQT